MFKKESIKDFINFKLLITETIWKWAFLVLAAIGAIVAIIATFAGWASAFAAITWNFGVFLGLFVGAPVLSIIAFVFYVFLLRIGFESLLVRFLTYREVRELNEKTKGQD